MLEVVSSAGCTPHVTCIGTTVMVLTLNFEGHWVLEAHGGHMRIVVLRHLKTGPSPSLTVMGAALAWSPMARRAGWG